MSEIEVVEQKIEHLRVDFSRQFADVREDLTGMRTDVKEIGKALTELIRLDGETKRQNDALKRIGRQVDDHETRLRSAETSGAAHNTEVKTKLGFHDHFVIVLIAATSNVLTGAAVYVLTH